jgi:polyisoprenoid-binding protein YceI
MTTQTTPTTHALGIALGTWTVDPARSKVGFAVRHLWGLATVRGSFDRFAGRLVVERDGANGRLAIDAGGLDTGNAKRDEHLRSEDFCYFENHREIVVAAESVASGEGGITISGQLRIGESIQRLDLPVEVEQHGVGLHIRATTSVTRESSGLSWNRLGMIRGDADLTLDLELTREVA